MIKVNYNAYSAMDDGWVSPPQHFD